MLNFVRKAAAGWRKCWPILLRRFDVYIRLTRLDKPIGSLLLLWPTLWALWVASEGLPTLHLFLVFTRTLPAPSSARWRPARFPPARR